MAAKYDVLIIGGGMVGSLLACALGDSPLKVAIVERTPARAPGAEYDLRVSAITLASRNMFRALGIWEALERQRMAPIREMHVWEAGGDGAIHFDSAEIGEPCLGYIIENGIVRTAMQDRLQQFTNIHFLCPAAVSGIDPGDDGVEVTLEDGRRLHARLLVGADGPRSLVREIAGIETRGWSFDQQGIVATVRTGLPHAHTAWQRFLPTGPLALLPLPGDHDCSIVWSADTGRAEELMQLGDTDFAAELNLAFGGRLGEIAVAGARAAYPLSFAHARAYIAPRIALVGDAAHVVHPLAGLGANLGFMDAAALAEVLIDAQAAGRDCGEYTVLRRYERWRKGDNLVTLAVTDGFKRFFGSKWPLVAPLRNLGLKFADQLTPFKNLVMRHATGLSGDLPRLARHAPPSSL